MSFRWISAGSDKAAAAMVVARICFKGADKEAAIRETLYNGHLCHFPQDIPEREMIRFRMMVEEGLSKTIERRKSIETHSTVARRSEQLQGDQKLHA
ncbi:hypothetical protein H7B90_00870 [Cohnella xylanilytica]|uniref:Uncharacterized protein n=1 Tax=Cohnella xylanilytica TaxID=557555 RepID=A0A841TWF3_9BACL|nr:hypothetical protein [Cohnella xylanilytica]MBB6689944.1 hypothetical protein [Cohnella xylanilytica]